MITKKNACSDQLKNANFNLQPKKIKFRAADKFAVRRKFSVERCQNQNTHRIGIIFQSPRGVDTGITSTESNVNAEQKRYAHEVTNFEQCSKFFNHIIRKK